MATEPDSELVDAMDLNAPAAQIVARLRRLPVGSRLMLSDSAPSSRQPPVLVMGDALHALTLREILGGGLFDRAIAIARDLWATVEPIKLLAPQVDIGQREKLEKLGRVVGSLHAPLQSLVAAHARGEAHAEAFQPTIDEFGSILDSACEIHFSLSLVPQQSAQLYQWNKIFIKNELSVHETAILLALCESEKLSVHGQRNFRRTFSRAFEKHDEDINFTNFIALQQARDIVGRDELVKEVWQQIRDDMLACRARDLQLWQRLAEHGDSGPATRRMSEMRHEVNLHHVMTSDLSRANHDDRHSAKEDTQFIETLQQQLSAALAEPSDFTSDLQRTELRQRLQQYRQGNRRGHNFFAAREQVDSDRVVVSIGDEGLDRLRNTRRADRARYVAGAIDFLTAKRDSLVLGVCVLPRQVVEDGTSLLHRLEQNADSRSSGTELVARQIRDIIAIAHYIDIDAQSDNLLYRRVQVINLQKVTLRFLFNQLAALKDEVKQRCRRVKPLAVDKNDTAGAIRRAAQLDAHAEVVKGGRQLAQIMACLPFDEEPQGDERPQTWEQVPSSTKTKFTPFDFDTAQAYFDRGTFASRWASARYHFIKHASTLCGATLAAYILQAKRVAETWPQAVARGEGSVRTSLAAGGKKVRVVSSSSIWLVMTDDPQPRIISYRDRQQRPYTKVSSRP